LFAHEYVIDLNGSRAAIAAGYSENGAHVSASRLLRNAKVSKLIEQITAERAKKLGLTAESVLSELGRMAFSNMLDYVTVQGGDAYVDLSKLTREQAAAIQEITVDEYTEGRGEQARQVKRPRFKLADKRGSLELLGKHLKLFTDKVEHSGEVGHLRDAFERMSSEELEAYVREAKLPEWFPSPSEVKRELVQ
jgi:phage terminase small subunit